MIEVEGLEDKLNNDGFVASGIRGISMYPFLKQGKDNVIISKLDKKVEKYDVVLFKNKDNYVLHRVIDINGNNLIIKGDNSEGIEKANINEILGILKAKYNKKGYIEINDDINKKYYDLSLKNKFFKRIRNSILFRIIRGQNEDK